MTARISRTLPWLPLVTMVAMLLLGMVTARGPLASADASVVPVTGSISADIFVDASACGPAAVSIGELVPGTDPWKTAQDNTSATCSVDFGTTNHLTGTTLTMLEDPGAPVSPAHAMKCIVASCSGDALDDYDNAAEPPAGTSAFGAQLLSSSGIATSVWSAAPAVHDVQNAGDATCETSTVGTGTCAFTWGATAATSDRPGTYQAQARLVVLAR